MGETRGRAVVVAALGVVAVCVGGLLGRAPAQIPQAQLTSQPESSPASPSGTIRVHVSGMVVAPGVVDVSPEAIVADAIDAAGGMLPGALVDEINLAAPVVEGDQIIVPGLDSGTEPASPGTDSADGVLSLSRATAAELETLPGVGPVLAERIIAFREENGGFESVEDLLEVTGIGEATLADIRDYVRP